MNEEGQPRVQPDGHGTQDGWVTLAEAARQLGVSPRTARRWIREGKLRAELHTGVYGPQYYIDATQIQTAHEVHDVIRVERQADMAMLAVVLERHLQQREGGLATALDELRAELREAIQRQEAWEATLHEELTRTRDALTEALAALRTAREPPPASAPSPSWWQRLRGRAWRAPMEG